MILPILPEDLAEIAKIHKENLPSLLAHYPVEFIERFYMHQLKKKSSVFIGFKTKDEPAGFIFGTTDLQALFKSFIAEDRKYFIQETCKVLLKKPRYFLYLAESFLGKKSNSEDSSTQLVYIATKKSKEKKGIGKQLLETFEAEMKSRADLYELEVEQNNPALGFYQKNGFYVVREINNILEKKFLMRKNLK